MPNPLYSIFPNTTHPIIVKNKKKIAKENTNIHKKKHCI